MDTLILPIPISIWDIPLNKGHFRRSQGVPIPLYTYHIALLREVSVTEALWSHPLDWQFHSLPMALALSVVVPLKHILRQTEI